LATPHDGSPSHLREMLLGTTGPYADPRDALDTLDNLQNWLPQISLDEQAKVSKSCINLIQDEDRVVASGAVLALDYLRSATSDQPLMDLLLTEIPSLQQPLVGFRRGICSTLGGQLATIAARCQPAAENLKWLYVLEQNYLAADRSHIVTALATKRPNLVLHKARDYFTDGPTSVMFSLPAHWQRFALATQFRPWPAAAIDLGAKTAQWMKWDVKDWAALSKVMQDDYPALTHPPGISDDSRWWIIGGDSAEWSLWKSNQDALIIEVLQPGYAYEFKSFPFPPELLQPLILNGQPAIADLLAQLRARTRR
jgi:hypothetical protein